jgi:hypothetical protein
MVRRGGLAGAIHLLAELKTRDYSCQQFYVNSRAPARSRSLGARASKTFRIKYWPTGLHVVMCVAEMTSGSE